MNDTMPNLPAVPARPARRATAIGASLALVAAAALAAGAPAAAVNGGACNTDYAPSIVPADFQDSSGQPNVIDNPWFPLIPGASFTYDGVKDGAPLHNVTTVTSDTRLLMGVTVRVVRDTASSNGKVIEDTFDWYAQDDAGDVWYFGEDTTTFDGNGNPVSTEGSWEAGDGPNRPGILMLADPRSGSTYRQEFAPDIAVDMATVLPLERHITVPYGRVDQIVETKEYSCLEKGIDHKFYAKGVGLVKELALANGGEYIELVDLAP